MCSEMKYFIVFTLCFVAIQAKETVETCYYCKTTDSKESSKNCRDPFDKKGATETPQCITLDFGLTSPSFAKIFEKEKNARSGEPTEYKCVKVSLLENGKEVFWRTCAPIRPTISTVCEYLKAEGPAEGLEIKSCNECGKTNCNGASTIELSSVVATIMLSVTLCFKYMQ